MKRPIKTTLIVLLTVGSLMQSEAVLFSVQSRSLLDPDPAAVERWKDLRFGMFIHWGPVSLTGYEIGWSRGVQTPIETYDNLYTQFNPTNFNASEWVSLAKDAGMKYIVLTTKHHDGFCLWDTDFTDYNIMNTPFGRDVTAELAAACHAQGVEFGTYYSVCDWYHPDFHWTSPGGKIEREIYDMDSYGEYLRSQIQELVVNCGPLLTVWNDVPQDFGARGEDTIRMVRQLQPDILINNRTGVGGDYGTPEQRIGGFDLENPWESCMTVSAHNHWAWGGADDGVKPLSDCLRMLIRAAGGDGNVLLNVGPRPDGIIDPEQANLLREIGAWLGQYGESIYETRGGPYTPTQSIACTRNGNTVYIHIMNWLRDTVVLPPLPATILSGRVLSGGDVTVTQTVDVVEIFVPETDRQEIDTIIKLELDQPAMSISPIELDGSEGNLAFGEDAEASNVYQDSSSYRAAMAVDGDSSTRWATDAVTTQCWLEVDLGEAKTFDLAVLEEYSTRVQSFDLQSWDGQTWQTFYSGGGIGSRLVMAFDPVTAQRVRLFINGSGGPTIYEFQLYSAGGEGRVFPLTLGRAAEVSNVYQNKNASYGGAKAVDGDSDTRWATDAVTTQCWLNVDLGSVKTFDHAFLEEYSTRTSSFDLQVQDGETWQTFYTGGSIGSGLNVTFDPVTAQIVRLLITGQGGPSIYEFQLFAP